SWDTQARNYISPSPTTVEIVQTSVAGMGYLAYGETPSPNMFTEATAYDSMNQAAQAIAEQRFDKAFTVVDEQLKHQVPDLLPLFANGLHYYRALALEALGQDDEALKEYVTIYEAAPESAWGRLARLHLEPLP
ncbi:MAG: hypothetical protein ABI690_35845, partial [Chloroflexota bacterium]